MVRISYGFEDALESLIRNPVFERDVDRVSLAYTPSSIFLSSRTRKIFSKLVERTRHDTIGRVEGFFDTISVVAVDIDVQNTGEDPE